MFHITIGNVLISHQLSKVNYLIYYVPVGLCKSELDSSFQSTDCNIYKYKFLPAVETVHTRFKLDHVFMYECIGYMFF